MNDDLKPCPFCGSPASAFFDNSRRDRWPWTVFCNNSKCNVGTVDYETREEAVAVWERRFDGSFPSFTPDEIAEFQRRGAAMWEKVVSEKPKKKRTKQEVRQLRSNPQGCCNRYAEVLSCSCMFEAEDE